MSLTTLLKWLRIELNKQSNPCNYKTNWPPSAIQCTRLSRNSLDLSLSLKVLPSCRENKHWTKSLALSLSQWKSLKIINIRWRFKAPWSSKGQHKQVAQSCWTEWVRNRCLLCRVRKSLTSIWDNRPLILNQKSVETIMIYSFSEDKVLWIWCWQGEELAWLAWLVSNQ